MQIPLISGINATERADFTTSYPVNLEPVPLDTGISKGYVRSASGAIQVATGPGIDRGGIAWNGVLYRVMGTKLVSVSAADVVTVIGDVGAGGPVAMDYGFDRLAINSGDRLYYWDGTTLAQVTDPDLGPCIDLLWMDGYFISSDGTSIVVTQLSDPTQIDPLKYGSAESDPDMITGLLRLRNELFVFGQNTIEVFTDQGGTGFPFQASTGATIPLGCVGARAKVRFLQSFAFVGGGRNQQIGVWLAGGGNATKLSTRAIDDILAEVKDLSSITVEARVSRGEERLLVHLPDKTLVCLQEASQAAGTYVWYVAASGRGMEKAYRPRNAIYVYNKWYVGDAESAAIGVLDDATGTHFGEAVGWRFDTQLLYNGTNSFIIHSLELVGLPGRHQTTPDPAAFFSYSTDGETWSVERPNALGRPNQRTKRVVWNIHRRTRNYTTLRFRGDSTALAGWAGLEAEVEALAA